MIQKRRAALWKGSPDVLLPGYPPGPMDRAMLRTMIEQAQGLGRSIRRSGFCPKALNLLRSQWPECQIR
jgi:hypothetical protein